MPTIDPTPSSFKDLFKAVPAGVPVVMLNLLRFRDSASYAADASEPQRSGRQAYAIYAQHALEQVRAHGGRVVMECTVKHAVIAPADEVWDEMLLVEYPSAEVFMNMVRSPVYQTFTHHRSAALADSRLIAMCAHRQ